MNKLKKDFISVHQIKTIIDTNIMSYYPLSFNQNPLSTKYSHWGDRINEEKVILNLRFNLNFCGRML